MKDTASPDALFGKIFTLPYLLGVYLAANAVKDAWVVVDGLNCVMLKTNFIAGDHDLFSTLMSASGDHRVLCTMVGPRPQQPNQENRLKEFVARTAVERGRGVVLLTALPFMRLAGTDYEGIAASISCSKPVAAVAPLSMEGDWLDGYAETLAALASALPAGRPRARKKAVAVVGYLHDRAEGDHAGNKKELARLLSLAGLELACLFPSGGGFRGLGAALEAGVVASLPYGRKAARRIAARSGARLVETGLPLGLGGTSDWLQSLREAAGLRGPLPPALAREERRAAARIFPALPALAHRRLLYAGDPYLGAAVLAFAKELCIRPAAAVLDCQPRELGPAPLPREVLFAPDVARAARTLGALERHLKPNLAVCNSFALTEGLAAGMPFVELGFPSYGHHCLRDEPFLGYAGAVSLVGRLLNAVQSAPSPR